MAGITKQIEVGSGKVTIIMILVTWTVVTNISLIIHLLPVILK